MNSNILQILSALLNIFFSQILAAVKNIGLSPVQSTYTDLHLVIIMIQILAATLIFSYSIPSVLYVLTVLCQMFCIFGYEVLYIMY